MKLKSKLIWLHFEKIYLFLSQIYGERGEKEIKGTLFHPLVHIPMAAVAGAELI